MEERWVCEGTDVTVLVCIVVVLSMLFIVRYLSRPEEGFFWTLYDTSGFRAIWEKYSPLPSPNQEAGNIVTASPPPYLLWFLAACVAFFGVASNRYENRVDIIENRANAILPNWPRTLGRRLSPESTMSSL